MHSTVVSPSAALAFAMISLPPKKVCGAKGVQRIKTWIEVAAKLSAPVVGAFADSQQPFKNWRQAAGNASREAVESWMAYSLHECAEHGQKFGIIVAALFVAALFSDTAWHRNDRIPENPSDRQVSKIDQNTTLFQNAQRSRTGGTRL